MRRRRCAERRAEQAERERARHQRAEVEAAVLFAVVGERDPVEPRHALCGEHRGGEREQGGGRAVQALGAEADDEQQRERVGRRQHVRRERAPGGVRDEVARELRRVVEHPPRVRLVGPRQERDQERQVDRRQHQQEAEQHVVVALAAAERQEHHASRQAEQRQHARAEAGAAPHRQRDELGDAEPRPAAGDRAQHPEQRRPTTDAAARARAAEPRQQLDHEQRAGHEHPDPEPPRFRRELCEQAGGVVGGQQLGAEPADRQVVGGAVELAQRQREEHEAGAEHRRLHRAHRQRGARVAERARDHRAAGRETGVGEPGAGARRDHVGRRMQRRAGEVAEQDRGRDRHADGHQREVERGVPAPREHDGERRDRRARDQRVVGREAQRPLLVAERADADQQRRQAEVGRDERHGRDVGVEQHREAERQQRLPHDRRRQAAAAGPFAGAARVAEEVHQQPRPDQRRCLDACARRGHDGAPSRSSRHDAV